MRLLPSLRQKKRYIVFEIIPAGDKKFSLREIEEEVGQALLLFFGQFGLAQAAPLLVKEKFNPAKQRFLLKINHKYTSQAKAALALIKRIKNTDLIIKSLTITGTLKKANEVLLK